MIPTAPTRGFTLLVAVILTSVLVSVSLAIYDVTYKQVVLASAAAQSQIAFYNADSALECTLYWDQKNDAFNYTTPLASGSIQCNNLAIGNYSTSVPSSGQKRTMFDVLCASGGSAASVTIDKSSTGATTLFANGFNTCDSTNTKRIERGLKASYLGAS